MQVVDPGHVFDLVSLDGGGPQRLVFVKREGAGYLGNVGHHSGTNCQEVLRVLISRVKYLDHQIEAPENQTILAHLRGAIAAFEERAARRHGRQPSWQLTQIELVPTCAQCGHIGCHAHTSRRTR